MPPLDLAPLSQVTTTGGSSLVPTDAPKGWVWQRDGASVKGSLAKPWGSTTSKISTIPALTPTGRNVEWSFATNAPLAIESASQTQQSGEPTLAYEGDKGESVPRRRRHPLERRVAPGDDDSPRPTREDNVIIGVGLGVSLVVTMGGLAWIFHEPTENHLDNMAAVDRVTRTCRPFWPKSLTPSAIPKRPGFGPKVTDTTETGQELQPYPTSTTNPNQKASEPPTPQHGEPSQPTSQTTGSRLSRYWRDSVKISAIRDRLGLGRGTEPAESVEEHQAHPVSTADANTQAPEPPTPQITRTSSLSSHAPSIDTIDGQMPVQGRDFIA